MHTQSVPSFARHSRFFIVALCLAVFALRVGGLHVHMCLDGSEPPVSFHVEDSGVHHLDEAEGGPHEDRDMALVSDVVLKKPFGDFDLTLLTVLSAVLLFLLARPRETFDFPTLPARFRSARSRLRPPPRAPPSLARLRTET
jgi:hypothetical protein